MDNMSNRMMAAMDQAHSKRGPSKGHLKATCPPMGTDAAIYWQAVQYETNVMRFSLTQMIFMTDDQREFFEFCVRMVRAARAGIRKAA